VGVRGLWVAELLISDRTEAKIIQRHGITPDEVKDAVVCVSGLDYAKSHHPERGWRFMVKPVIRGRRVLVVLYDAEDPLGDVYHLGSAYFIEPRQA
jgi:hypothetical protein